MDAPRTISAADPDPDEGLANLVSRLVADAKDYGRAEVAYVQALARDRTADAGMGAGLLAGAAVIAISLLTTLMVGLVLSLEPLVGPFLATLIVTICAAVIAGIVAKMGLNRIKHATRESEASLT